MGKFKVYIKSWQKYYYTIQEYYCYNNYTQCDDEKKKRKLDKVVAAGLGCYKLSINYTMVTLKTSRYESGLLIIDDAHDAV